MTEGAQAQRDELLRKATWLVAFTIAYNVIEAGVALVSGAAAGSSVLVAFGLDSVVECFAAGALLWRLRARGDGAQRELVAERLVGWSFLVLAAYVTATSGLALWQRNVPESSRVGITLGVLSLVIMPGLAWMKLRIAHQLESRALRAEAIETLACSYLTVTLLGGLVANAAFGWWWADPTAALAMAPWLVKEGLEGIRGQCSDD